MSGKRNRTLKGEAAGGAEAEGASPCSDRVPAHGRHFGEPACGPKWRRELSNWRIAIVEKGDKQKGKWLPHALTWRAPLRESKSWGPATSP